MAHALRRAQFELGLPGRSRSSSACRPTCWMTDDFHEKIAEVLRRRRAERRASTSPGTSSSRPASQLQAFGWATAARAGAEATVGQLRAHLRRSERQLGADDEHAAVGRHPRHGGRRGSDDREPRVLQHVGAIAGWLGVPGNRMRSVMGNTIVMKGRQADALDGHAGQRALHDPADVVDRARLREGSLRGAGRCRGCFRCTTTSRSRSRTGSRAAS